MFLIHRTCQIIIFSNLVRRIRKWGFQSHTFSRHSAYLLFLTKGQSILYRKKIVHAQQTPWPPSLIDFRSLNETQIFAIIVDKILCLVAETVTVEVQYAGIVAPSPQIRFARNGMGDPRVWHGFSDAFLNTNTSVHSWNCEAEMDEDSEAEESSVCEEGKWNIGEKKLYLPQLVTSAVINLIHRRHKILSTIIANTRVSLRDPKSMSDGGNGNCCACTIMFRRRSTSLPHIQRHTSASLSSSISASQLHRMYKQVACLSKATEKPCQTGLFLIHRLEISIFSYLIRRIRKSGFQSHTYLKALGLFTHSDDHIDT